MVDKKKEAPQEEGPTGKVRNIPPGGNIMNDSFFDVLGDLDDGLSNPNFSKLGEETKDTISDVIKDDSLNLTPKEETKKESKSRKIASTALPAAPLPRQQTVKEKNMAKKYDPLNLPDDDPASQQMKEIWDHMNTPDASEYKLMVLRLEPQVIKGMKISGYLQTFHLPTTIPDIIEKVGETYGGGKYQIKIVDGAGKYVKSKTFEISGLPKIPIERPPSSTTTVPETTTTVETPVVEETKQEATPELEDDDWDDDDEFEFPRRRRGLQPLGGSPYGSQFGSPYNPMGGSPYSQRSFSGSAYGKQGADDLDTLKRDMEDKVIRKMESKFDNMTNMFQNTMNANKKESFFNADVVKALAPLAVTFLDNKSNRDTNNSSQFTEMNKQIVGLMEGMQNLVRIGDKTREDYTEKERNSRGDLFDKERHEREQTRREAFEFQQATEKRFMEEQRRSEERHQQMMLQLKESLESKHRDALGQEQSSRAAIETLRIEAREREDRSRQESKDREERIRDEARQRDDESRRKEMEFWENQRQQEMKWRAELQVKEEEARRRDDKWREDSRQKELEKERELKVRELEMMKTIQEMNNNKSGMQHKLLEQVYSNNNQNRESQLQMEMAITRMTSDNEARMMQAGAEMQLEKIRHATQMQIGKMRTELSAFETKKDDDPLDTAMQDYLKRRLQIDMIKELNMDVDDDELPSGGIMGIAKQLLSGDGGIGSMLLKGLLGGGGGGGGGVPQSMPRPPASGRVVAPNPSPPPKPVIPVPTPTTPTEEDLDDYEDELDDYYEEDVISDEDEDEAEVSAPDLADPLSEIPRVIQFFQYLKEAIETGEVTPEMAAEEAKNRLSPTIVTYLIQIQDSNTVISQLEPLLSRGVSIEFAEFFVQEECILYMDHMLASMAGIKLETPEPTSKSAPEHDDEDEDGDPMPEPKPAPETKAKKPAKKARKTKAKAVKADVVVDSPPKEEKPKEEKPKKRTRKKRTTKKADVQ